MLILVCPYVKLTCEEALILHAGVHFKAFLLTALAATALRLILVFFSLFYISCV